PLNGIREMQMPHRDSTDLDMLFMHEPHNGILRKHVQVTASSVESMLQESDSYHC
ncbi:hypothetical protein HAX54_008005, partial [Datura stramonium]|nr:hypothetical protein [Datura stramonium]